MFCATGSGANTWSVGNLATKRVTINGQTYMAWDTANVTNMRQMFCFGYEVGLGDSMDDQGSRCMNWNIGDISNWNTSKVTDMMGMFYCAGYIAKNVSLWDFRTKNVTVGSNTYTAWDTSNVTNMSYMFEGFG